MSKFAMNLVEKFKLDLVLVYTTVYTKIWPAELLETWLVAFSTIETSVESSSGTSVEVSGETLVETSHMYNVH